MLSACQYNTTNSSITIQNYHDFAIVNKTLSISGNELENIKKDLPKYFEIKSSDQIIPYQWIDTNEDGAYDEFLIEDDFKAGESKEYTVIAKDSPQKFTSNTNIHFAIKAKPDDEINEAIRLTESDSIKSTFFQMEGPAWENDKVAFRNYFDQRNGIDIFGKQTEEMILNKVGVGEQNYHELSDWGMDILKVGASLGAGAIALKKGDKIYRIASANPATYRLKYEGSLKSAFVLKFNNINIGDSKYTISHEISIAAGDNHYHSEVQVKGLKGEESLVSGIVNLHSDSLYTFTQASTYGIYTYDLQSENKDHLGMAILTSKNNVISTGELPADGEDIVSTYYLEMKFDDQGKVSFDFFSAWERENTAFSTRDGFEKMLKAASL